jgi:hypothetical protein
MRSLWPSAAAIGAAVLILILTHATGVVGLIGVAFLALSVLFLLLRPAGRTTALQS